MRGPLEKAEVISLKRFSLVLCLVLALSLVFVGAAFANFGPHGGYATDTDSCAGCHRAHTSFSAVRFEPSAGPGPDPSNPASESALLVGGAATVQEFCFACHGDQAPGASTNVEMGIFDAGPSTANMAATSALQPYQTESIFDKPLNGGGFTQAAKDWDWDTNNAATYNAVTSAHNMESSVVMWGAGNGADTNLYLTCVSCHDPHGSSNYRLLKDQVNGLTVGGYTRFGTEADGGSNYDYTADPYVKSTETSYPAAGWTRGPDGADEMIAYKPDYTGGTKIAASQDGGQHSLSTWCAACHENYNDKSNEMATDGSSSGGLKDYGTYEAAGSVNAKTRHRHPVNISLVSGDSVLYVQAQYNSVDPRIPLEILEGAANYRSNNVGCLTCHVAHGSSQTMTGWAAASLIGTSTPTTPTVWMPELDGVAGVDPDKSAYEPGGAAGTSALLRADNRGVCERCHNK